MADTVSRNRDLHGNSEMTIIGYLMAAIMLVVVLPLLPIVLLLFIIDRLLGPSNPGGEPGQPTFE